MEYNIDLILQKVMEEIQKRGLSPAKKALLIYTGAKIGFDDALSSICELRAKGYAFDVFFTRGAAAALDAEIIRAHAEPERFMTDCGEEPPEAIVKAYDTVIVPALTINTAAKLSQCIMDNPATRMIFTAMMLGKNVIVAKDGCCPDCPVRAELGYKMAEPLKAQLRENLRKVKSYGAVVTTAAELASAVLALEKTESAPAVSAQAVKKSVSKKISEGSSPKRPIITRRQVDACPAGGELRIPKNSIVTALAQDIAIDRGITIIKE